MAKRGIVKNRKAAQGNNVGQDELAEGGQDAEKHNYPTLKQVKKEKVFATNTLKGPGSKNKGSVKGNPGGVFPKFGK